jgi:hypothetical protein
MEAISAAHLIVNWRGRDTEDANPHEEEHANEIHWQFVDSSECNRFSGIH